MLRFSFLLMMISLTWGSAMAMAATMGPAPKGEATEIAQKIIHDNFDVSDCPLVVGAKRFGDGSIKAVCNTGEDFRVFSINKKPVAMKCSALKAMGISGC
jgi:hypothetical protein